MVSQLGLSLVEVAQDANISAIFHVEDEAPKAPSPKLVGRGGTPLTLAACVTRLQQTSLVRAQEKVSRLEYDILAIGLKSCEVEPLLKRILHEVMGWGGLERLNALIADYNSASPGVADAGIATRAENIAEAPDTLQEVRSLFFTYSRLTDALKREGSQLRSFRTLSARVDFIHTY